ncbi:response regulator transcription factor [Aureibacter tunicatorum]|uniref:DNA-binding response OmpR family regulator n=1 Tax=Aureibacter tunicatorum TaxID=866807 RepID=A0AAE3XMT3_9BACT|nr:response regulator transcription factor [Aureibacter tunicatorum]MDR6240801.1 DNA-binding response OmpR family regulator [Aureibacter tunicatorum]BDD06866.1 DNA-binding response regulator [Aureibacter tunicatorum]
MKKKILYAEDDKTLAFLTSDSLEQLGYEVSQHENGRSAIDAFQKSQFDICILDVMLPIMDGFQLAQEIRKIDQQIPIIFLSAKTLKEDRIKGLRLGADDYLVKPFSIEELNLKIEIFLQRSNKTQMLDPESYNLGKLLFLPKKYLLETSNESISLTQKESDVLLLLAKNQSLVLKREEILVSIWGDDDYFMGRSLDVFISRLRKKLKHDDSVSIENHHGIGFQLIVSEN